MKIITDNSCFYEYLKYLGKFITQFYLPYTIDIAVFYYT